MVVNLIRARDIDLDIVSRIKKLQKDKGLNMAQFASTTKVSRSTLYSIYGRDSEPTVRTVTTIASAFGMTFQEFCCEGYVPPGLTEKEKQVLEYFRDVGEKSQDVVLMLLEHLVMADKEKNN